MILRCVRIDLLGYTSHTDEGNLRVPHRGLLNFDHADSRNEEEGTQLIDILGKLDLRVDHICHCDIVRVEVGRFLGDDEVRVGYLQRCQCRVLNGESCHTICEDNRRQGHG